VRYPSQESPASKTGEITAWLALLPLQSISSINNRSAIYKVDLKEMLHYHAAKT
jgi:hypothetical protein